jgi:nicotinamidase-related amidase
MMALLVIDLQRGAFDGVRCPPVAEAPALIGHALELLAAARAAAVPVVFVQHCEGAGEPFEEGTVHGELHEALAPLPGEAVVKKRASSAFEGTDLADRLTAQGASQLVLCGLQSEHCVANTARSALGAGYEVLLAADGHGTWPWDGEAAATISARINDTLESAGAKVAPTAALAQRLSAGAAA